MNDALVQADEKKYSDKHQPHRKLISGRLRFSKSNHFWGGEVISGHRRTDDSMGSGIVAPYFQVKDISWSLSFQV